MISLPRFATLQFFIQPLLIALYPAFFLYAQNPEEVAIKELLFLLLFIAIASICSVGLCSWLLKSLAKASVIASFFWFLFFSLVPCSCFLSAYSSYLKARYILLLGGIVFCYVVIKIKKSHRTEFVLGRLFILPYTILLVWLLWSVGSYKWRMNALYAHAAKDLLHNSPSEEELFSELNKPATTPSIYYIILDMYASVEAIKQHCDYDNTPFIEELRRQGFMVMNNSYSNYGFTMLSLPSSLNMSYLDFHDHPQQPENAFTRFLLNTNVVTHFFKKRGYTTICIPSTWEYEKQLSCFDKEISYSLFGDFYEFLGGMSLFHMGGRLAPSLWSLYMDERKRNWLSFQFRQLEQCSRQKEPLFVYAHIMSPHFPYLYDKEGNAIRSYGKEIFDRDALRGQIQALNKKVTATIETILKNSTDKPIIIIQGDHGINCDLTNKPVAFGILNAYHFPDDGKKIVYDSISPVNSFRMIFNHYFKTHFGRLEDCSYTGIDDEEKCKEMTNDYERE